MSYSRWSNSEWYSFWSTASGPTKDEQILSLWYSMDMTKDWTYAELKQISIEDLTIEYSGVPHNVLKEGWEIIQAFIADVDGASEEELQESYADFLANECGVEDVDLSSNISYNGDMKILSEYLSDDGALAAKVFRTDEETFLVSYLKSNTVVSNTYYNALETAENEAENFVMNQ